MKEFISRLIDEEKELANKISKLIDFLDDEDKCKKISNRQLELLKFQLNSMRDYDKILRARLQDLDVAQYLEELMHDSEEELDKLANEYCLKEGLPYQEIMGAFKDFKAGYRKAKEVTK